MRGAILAGGNSSRFDGKPKGLERVGGERIVDRIIRAMQAALGSPPLVVANDEGAETWFSGQEIIADVMPGCGSLGGIYTAVAHHDSPVLVVAWDMPFVTTDLLVHLKNGVSKHDLYLPASHNAIGVEPMCGVYGGKSRPVIKAALDDEDYRATGFHESLNVGTVPIETIEEFGPPEKLFFNVNTAEDLKRAEELWREQE